MGSLDWAPQTERSESILGKEGLGMRRDFSVHCGGGGFLSGGECVCGM